MNNLNFTEGCEYFATKFKNCVQKLDTEHCKIVNNCIQLRDAKNIKGSCYALYFANNDNVAAFVYNFNTNKGLLILEIDNCILKASQKGDNYADYLILDCDKKIAFFVELKGKDSSHAIKQLNTTIKNLANMIQQFKIRARAVMKVNNKKQTSQEIPASLKNTSDYKELIKRIKKENFDFSETGVFEENL
jgi:hypothetical protein